MANYYFDANALIKYSLLQEYKIRLGEIEQGIDEIQKLVSSHDNKIFFSSLTLLETWKVIFDNYRKGVFGERRKTKNRNLEKVLTQLENDLKQPPFEVLDVIINENVITQSRQLIVRYGSEYNTGTLDMLHLALIQQSTLQDLIMVSSDRGIKTICNDESISIFDPQSLS